MGRLEKIVVLTVLFLVAVVLGVALNTDSGAPGRGAEAGAGLDDNTSGPGGPLRPTGALSADVLVPPANGNGGTTAGSPEVANGGGGAPGAVPKVPENSVQVPPSNPSPAPSPAPVPETTPPAPGVPAAAPFLATREGLEPSNDPKLMFYTWKANDSFAGLAQTYYGSKDKLARLQKVNEGKTDANMKAGERIWIPVVDDAAATQTSLGGAKVYVVKQGDVLSGISKEFYGTAKKWQKILDANKDVLSRPEALRPGMKLRIPE